MLLLNMKRFLSYIFVILILCNPISHAQDKAEPSQSPSETSAAKKSDIPTVGTDTEPNQKPAESDKNTVSSLDVTNEDVPVDNRTIEVAEEANGWAMWQTIINGIGLFLLLLTTVFARGAWLAARNGVKVTRDIGQKQTKAYLSVKSAVLWVPVTNGEKGWFSKNDVFKFTLKTIFENTGNTPAHNVSYKFRVRLFGGGENLLVSDFGNTHSYGIVGHNRDTSGTLKYAVSTEAPANGSDSIRAIHVRTCYITIRAEYSDVFDNRWYIESTFEGAPFTADGGTADNVKDLTLDHWYASDKQGKVKHIKT